MLPEARTRPRRPGNRNRHGGNHGSKVGNPVRINFTGTAAP